METMYYKIVASMSARFFFRKPFIFFKININKSKNQYPLEVHNLNFK